MKVALIIPWFGKELKGGAEQQAWQIAKRLTDRKIDIEVLTTCSKEFLSDWSENFYDAKEYIEDGVKIKRFSVKKRDTATFDAVNRKLMQIAKTSLIPGVSPLSKEEENIFLDENIYSSDLHSYIVKEKDNYDIFIFLPYLFPNIIRGVNAVKEKAVIQPCLHDESYAYLECVQENFYNTKSILYLSDGEFEVAKKIYGPSIVPKSKVLYAGVETDGTLKSKYERYLLYLGRRDIGKNTHLLIESFDRFLEETGSDLKLLIAGVGEMPIQPKSKSIIDLGLVDEEKKTELLANCLALINPSENESFSRVIFEAWYVKKPIVIHKKCLATYNALLDAGEAGFSAQSQDDFAEVYKKLDSLSIEQLKKMGEVGFSYAKKVADWDNVIDRYLAEFNALTKERKSNKKQKIILTYFNVGANDAVGYDLLYEYEVLVSENYDVAIYAEVFDPALDSSKYKTITKRTLLDELTKEDTILIYHHANYWENGYELLKRASCRIVLKYHNITPSHFFEPYFQEASVNCTKGRKQTKEIVELNKRITFFADSKYNAKELIELGIDKSNISIHPPFYKMDEFTGVQKDSNLSIQLNNNNKLKLLFVGRVSPNKGHIHLIEVIRSYVAHYGNDIELNIVGGKDPNLHKYNTHLEELIKRYRLVDNVKFHDRVSLEILKTYYEDSDIFLIMSEHEGFCVPILEAQHHKLPIIALNSTAVPDTLGKEQLIFDEIDYDSFASALHMLKIDEQTKEYLTEQGTKNYKKYHSAIVAQNFVEELANSSFGGMKNNGVKVIESEIFSNKPKKILIIKLDHNGDLILSIPALTKLKNKYPNAKIDIVLGSWNKEIVKKLNIFTNIFTFDYFKMQSSETPKLVDKETRTILSKLDNYDIAIDLRRQRDTRFLVVQTKASLHVGYQTHDESIDSKLDICLPSEIDIPKKMISHNEKSTTLQMMALVDALPIDINDFVDFPILSDKNRIGVQIALFPKAGNSIKEWPIEKFTELSNRLIINNKIDKINVYLTNNDKQIAKYFTKNKKIQFHINLSYQKLFDSLKENMIAVVNNSFGAHISSYLGLETISIYGGHETVKEWQPVFGKNTIIYSDVSCSPCHCANIGDCEYDLVCLKQIDVSTVYEEIEKSIILN